MKCPHCGKEIADNSKFCEFCGWEIKPNKKNNNVWSFVIAILLLAIVGLLTMILVNNQRNSDDGFKTVTVYPSPLVQDTPSVAPIKQDTPSVAPIKQDTPSVSTVHLQQDSIPASPSRSDFVDLGLPSGTQWKSASESGGDYNDGLYTHEDAMRMFGSQLPTKAQLTELYHKCQWTWNGSGYDVTGPNGRSISFPLTGYRESDGTPKNQGVTGNYWTKEIRQEATYKAWKLYFRSDHMEICSWPRVDYHAVRLVRQDSPIEPASSRR